MTRTQNKREELIRAVVRSQVVDLLTLPATARRLGIRLKVARDADSSAMARALRIYVYSLFPAPSNRRDLIRDLEDEGVSASTIRRLMDVSVEAPAHAPVKVEPVEPDPEKTRAELALEAAELVRGGMTILQACAKVGLSSNYYYKQGRALRLPSRRRGRPSNEQRAQLPV